MKSTHDKALLDLAGLVEKLRDQVNESELLRVVDGVTISTRIAMEFKRAPLDGRGVADLVTRVGLVTILRVLDAELETVLWAISGNAKSMQQKIPECHTLIARARRLWSPWIAALDGMACDFIHAVDAIKGASLVLDLDRPFITDGITGSRYEVRDCHPYRDPFSYTDGKILHRSSRPFPVVPGSPLASMEQFLNVKGSGTWNWYTS